MSFLECKDLVMRFGGVTAIGGVNFSMIEGTVHCLIGPNGAGKSTFFKMVTGQLNPTEGTVKLRDDDITGLRSSEIVRRGVGIKTQTPQLFDELTAQENIWLGAHRSVRGKAATDRVHALIEDLELTKVTGLAVGTLAHGIRQRVEIASVLAGNPDLILLDEPAAGMSDADVEHIAKLILRLKARHSFLVVEHDMRFIRRIADRVTVFHQGRIFIEGDCETVLADRGVQDIYLGKGLIANA
ncbi:ABC transporter ATP-binding protein (plasmid) [Rhizobium sp. NIBRBAC000502774]|nr:ABC transporter ATP-binding protein [Rhizobium sp. NIBRBAC000502774]